MANYRNTYNGTIRSSEGTLGYPWVALDDQGNVPEAVEVSARTADAILLDVGDDPVLAAAALSAEQEREKPRSVLSAKLQAIVDAGQES